MQKKNLRKGLRPLSVQIGMAASYWPHNFAAEDLQQKQIPKTIETMLLGIRKYEKHPFEREDLPLDVIWQKGAVSVGALPSYDCGAAAPTLILVPSLINKASIFDLMQARSMLRYFSARNINTYLLDWGSIIDDPGAHDIEGLVMDRFVPALEFLHKKYKAPVHALGYCMGGTLLMGAAKQAQEHLASLIMLAAPWDFHAGSQALLNCVKFWAPSAFPAIEEKGVLDVDWIQTVFSALDPFMAAKKFSRFLEMEEGSEEENLFVAVEDWLNDGLPLPAAIAQHCLRDWFLKNLPGTGGWVVGGEPVIPEEINISALIVASDKDRLVEYETASVLQKQIPAATLINPSCGHIGMIAGQNAVEKVWKPIADWILRPI